MGPASLEVKLAEILISAVALLGLGTWTGYHFTREHYEVLQLKEQHASDEVLANARQAIIQLTTERDAALAQEAKDHEQWVKADSDARAATADSVHGLSAAVRACAVSRPVADSGGRPGSNAGGNTSGDQPVQQGGGGLDAALAEYDASSLALVDVCQRGARSLTAIYEVAPKSSAPPK